MQEDKYMWLFLCVLVVCFLLAIIIPTIKHYEFINNCVKEGYSQTQNIGTAGYHWEKN